MVDEGVNYFGRGAKGVDKVKKQQEESELDSLLIIRKLSNIPRYSGTFIFHKQSVAEHSFHVAILAYMIKTDEKCVSSTSVYMSLFHDLNELYSGDVNYIIMEKNPGIEEMINVFVSKQLEKRSKMNRIWDYVYHIWKDYLKKSMTYLPRESRVVDAADKLELVLFCYEEYLRGNKEILKILYKGLKILRQYDFKLVKGVRREIMRRVLPYVSSDVGVNTLEEILDRQETSCVTLEE